MNAFHIFLASQSESAALLLDRIDSAAFFAFDFNKLSSSYAGPCLRVRRITDNAETNLGFDGTGAFDWAAAAAFGSDLRVVKIYNQSGDNHLIAPSAGSQATLNQTTKRLDFDGAEDCYASLDNFDLSSVTGVSVFAKAEFQSNGFAPICEFTPNWNVYPGAFILGVENNFLGGMTATYNYKTASFLSGENYFSLVLNRAVATNDQTALYVNGTASNNSTITGNSNPYFADDKLYIGARNSSAAFLHGSLKNLILLDSAVTPADRLLIESHI